ncbi:hypothetical protein V1511DRAFT_511694 [Dipodascopsis uninucleata]
MNHKNNSSISSVVSEDDNSILQRTESIEQPEVQTATAAIARVRPTQVIVNSRRISGTPSVASVASDSTITPGHASSPLSSSMPPPARTSRGSNGLVISSMTLPTSPEEAAPNAQSSPTGSTTSFFTSNSSVHPSDSDDGFADAAAIRNNSIDLERQNTIQARPATVVPVAASPSSALPTVKQVSSYRLAQPASGATGEKAQMMMGISGSIPSSPSGSAEKTMETGGVYTDKSKRKKRFWIIFAAILLAVAIGVGVGVGVGVGTKKSNSTSNLAPGASSTSTQSSSAILSSSTASLASSAEFSSLSASATMSSSSSSSATARASAIETTSSRILPSSSAVRPSLTSSSSFLTHTSTRTSSPVGSVVSSSSIHSSSSLRTSASLSATARASNIASSSVAERTETSVTERTIVYTTHTAIPYRTETTVTGFGLVSVETVTRTSYRELTVTTVSTEL